MNSRTHSYSTSISNNHLIEESSESDSGWDITNSGLNIFVLCMYCTRMVFVQATPDSDLAKMLSTSARFSLAVTTCRACNKQLPSSRLTPNASHSLSIDVIRNTHMYDCACKVAGDNVTILPEHRIAVSISVNGLVDKLSTDCRMYGICRVKVHCVELMSWIRRAWCCPFHPGVFSKLRKYQSRIFD